MITQFPFVEKVVTPYILLLVTTPMLALVPLLILRFGFGSEPRIIAVALASGPMVMINSATGFRRVDLAKIALARSFGASTLQIFTKIRIPMAMPMIIVGLMVGSIFGLLTTVGAEMVGGAEGLGNRLTYYSSLIRMPQFFAIILILAIDRHFDLRLLLLARQEMGELGGMMRGSRMERSEIRDHVTWRPGCASLHPGYEVTMQDNEGEHRHESTMTRSLAIDRRRLLTATAAGVSVATLGPVGRALAQADAVRWVSPRGTLEVLDDYPYWVGQEVRLFRRHRDDSSRARSDATAMVKLVDQNQADMGYPSPGVFSLGLAQGMPLVSVFQMWRRRRVRLRLPQGRGAGRHQGPRGQDHRARQRRLAVDRRSDAEGGGRRHRHGEICRCRLADLGHRRWRRARATRRCPGRACARNGRARASTSTTSSAATSRSSRPTASSSARPTSTTPAKSRRLRPLPHAAGARARVRPHQSARRDADRHGAVPRPRLADDAGGRDRVDDADRDASRPADGRSAAEVGLPHHAELAGCSSTPVERSARSPGDIKAEDVVKNDLVAGANEFDAAKVKADADGFELSEEYKAVDVEAIRAAL